MTRESVPAMVVHQWLEEWDTIHFDPTMHQRKPEKHFYLFSMKASKLRKLSGIYRRDIGSGLPRERDLGVQRQHDPLRSQEIGRYIEGGYPWSTLSTKKRDNPDYFRLKKPGWLPTAVVVNILTDQDLRLGAKVSPEDMITISGGDDEQCKTLSIPDEVKGEIPPIEVIDGQHRLFAFDDDESSHDDYDLPVVAFSGLDVAWQAYLFWTINIKPKKINASLAFDLYPLLREQSWLYEGESIPVYKESRAQDLTASLWSYPQSPWHERINMLGGSKKENGFVTQAAFIRSLTSSMIKRWDNVGPKPGGLFGGSPSGDGLSWSRVQQAAFLIGVWQCMQNAVNNSHEAWAESIRKNAESTLFEDETKRFDPAFADQTSLLATDQGVRGFQSVINDLCRMNHDSLGLQNWEIDNSEDDPSSENLDEAINSFKNQEVFQVIGQICDVLQTFDWRTSSAYGVTDTQQLEKSAFRGSGGYVSLRKQLLIHLKNHSREPITKMAAKVL